MDLQDEYNTACELLSRNKLWSALVLLRKLAEIAPNDPAIWLPLAVALQRNEEPGEAAQYFLKIVRATPDRINLRHYAAALRDSGRGEDIVPLFDSYKESIWSDPDSLGAWGSALLTVAHYDEALKALTRAVELDPTDISTCGSLATCMLSLGMLEEAVQCFTDLMTVPLESYDKNLKGDAVAEIYNDGLYEYNEVHKTVPAKNIVEHNKVLTGRAFGKVLDLCCGTGFLAEYLPTNTHIVGIDISSGMVEKAEKKNLYKRLIVGDIFEEIKNTSEIFNTVFCASAIYHICDLVPIFREINRVLDESGVFIASFDPLTDDSSIAGIKPGPGTFCHSRQYLRSVAAQTGFEVRSIRIDHGRAAPGFYAVFQKSAGRPA